MIRNLARGACLALLVAACAYTYRLEIPETRTQSAAGITDISVESKNGSITVDGTGDTTIYMYITRVAWGRNEEDARKAIAEVVVSNTLVDTKLQLKAQMPAGNRNYGAAFQVVSPPAVGLSLVTNNSEITVSGMTRSVTATTSNGRIRLTGTRGPAVLNTTNGEIRVLVHEGSVNAQTSNGAIIGDIAELRTDEAVTLRTSNGAVTLLLPEDVSATIDATTTNGTITISDFAVSYEIQEAGRLRGRIGSGVSTINITTSNGDVIVRRRS